MKIAIIGGGVIGGGWAARFILNGHDVKIYDPAKNAHESFEKVLQNARFALPALYDKSLPQEGEFTFVNSLEDAVSQADWVQESIPENLSMKQDIFQKIHKLAPNHAIIASSTSGFRPNELNAHDGRAIVAHPFNPVYLLPLVELVGDLTNCKSAATILKSIGMYPLIVKKEIDAHIADRLLEAVWREALWLVNDDIATTAEIDEAIRMGFGLRWAQMGLFETYRIAGGEAGMAHFLEQFGPALEWNWTKLMDVPDFTPELIAKISAQSDAQSGQFSIRELERIRDKNLIAILRGLKHQNHGAGKVLKAHEQSLNHAPPQDLPITVARQIPPSWTDYNGHMNEAHYVELSAQASDQMLAWLGCDEGYISSGKSYFTLENHIRYLAELKEGESISIKTQIISAQGKLLRFFHSILKADGSLAATVETLLIHMDLEKRKSSLPEVGLLETIQTTLEDHNKFPHDPNIGKGISLAH